MKRNFVLSGLVSASLVTLAACGGGAGEAPAEETTTTEEAPAEETAAEAPAEEAAEPAPEVEANGTVIEIQMLTKDPEDSSNMQLFKPRIVKANVGDTIKFVPTDPTHQSSSIDGMLPAGVTGWEGEINKEVSFVIPKEGVYGYKCVPHYAAGMVGLIIVGEGGENVEAAKGVKHPGLAGREFNEIFEEAGL